MERDVSPHSWLDEPGTGAAAGHPGYTDPLLAGLARRICGHAERQLTIAERLGPESLESAELAAGARRLLRDGESVLSLAGGRPERRGAVPTGIGRVLADTAAGAEEPRRVGVPPAPSASLPPDIAVSVGQVLAELLAHAERVTPRSGRIELVGRWAGDGGVTIEVVAEGVELPWQQAAALENEIAGGPAGPVPPERLGLHLAARLARRCGARVELQAPLGGPTTPGFGTVALVRFPRALVEPASAVQPQRPAEPALSWEPVRAGAAPAPASIDELFGSFDPGHDRTQEDLAGTPIFAAVASAWFRTDDDPVPAGAGWSAAHSNGSRRNGANGHARGDALGGWSGFGGTAESSTNGAGSSVDNGTAGSAERNGHGVADSWLGGPGSSDWSSTGDAEWRAAAERAAQEADPAAGLPVTDSGLPMRRPGKQMITPSLRSGRAAAAERPSERAPDRVRSRLSTYQRGLEAGRHRAADPEEERTYQDAAETELRGLGERPGAAFVPRPTSPAPQPQVELPSQGPVPGPALERYEDIRDPWTGEGLWPDDPRR